MREDEHEITTADCWALLRSRWIGRVSLSLNALPTILPVEYCVSHDELYFCLGHYRVPRQAVANTVVGFAADVIDETAHQGWTVHVQGRSNLARSDTQTCGTHQNGQIVHVAPEIIHGQTLELCPVGYGLLTNWTQTRPRTMSPRR
jgi:hypothetical protein